MMWARRPEFSRRFLIPFCIISAFIYISFFHRKTIYGFSEGQLLVGPSVDPEQYREIYALSTPDGRYFNIDFVDEMAINPNILPHPTLNDTWVMVAQRHNNQHVIFVELVCNAAFRNGVFRCIEPTKHLSYMNTTGNKCEGNIKFIDNSIGPHDARAFYGPDGPYTTYGSNSAFICFGQFVQDFRALVPWDDSSVSEKTWFSKGTEMRRPPPWKAVEKNWFLFWDTDGAVYAHYDVVPQRSFAKLNSDGSVGEDLAPQATFNDEKCLAKYVRQVENDAQSIHQATNSLLITLCPRGDPSCKPDESNTFIAAIYHWKNFEGFHSVYEPYVILFEQKAPFKVHGISTKPLWVHGRGRPMDGPRPKKVNYNQGGGIGRVKPWEHSELLYVTSWAWKTHGQKYHGYSDDVVFLSFGIEDHATAGMDLAVGDLLMDIGLCSDS